MTEVGPISPARLREILSEMLPTLGTDVATETTLRAIKAQTDKLQFDASNFLRAVVQNFPTDYFKSGQSIGESPFNVTKVAGTSLSSRDWSSDFAKLQNLDTALSTRASETTLSGIKTQTDKLQFDTSNFLKVAIQNFPTDYFKSGQSIGESPFNVTKVAGTALTARDWSSDFANLQNLDTTLSTRASEATLSAIKNALASVGTDKLRASIVDALPSGTNKIGSVDVVTLPVTKGDWLSVLPNPSNLDVTLSSRASESTLSGIKTQTDKLTFDASNRLAIQNPPNLDTALSNVKASIDNTNIAKISGTSLTARDWSSDFAKLQNLDIALSALQALIRWGRNVTPAWVLGAENTAPAAGTALVSKTVSTGKTGYIYGFIITAQEVNDFKINWTSGGSSKSLRITFGGKGTTGYTNNVPMNEGIGADAGTSITITNVNAGGSGVVYQACLLVAEV
jgi:hypothetical protein